MEIEVKRNESKEEAQLRSWLVEVEAARKRESPWRKKAEELVKIYEAAKENQDSYNILYANTDTLAPALYNSTPRPVVQRRYKDNDPLGKAAAGLAQRVLEYLIDSGDNEYPAFDELMSSAVLEALVPGRGLTRFKYQAYFENGEGGEKISSEHICGEPIPWNRFIHGYGKKWKDVPWIGVIHYMTRAELAENFGEEIAGQVKLSIAESPDSEERTEQPGKDANIKYALVYEIWDKQAKKVLFISEGYEKGVLKETGDTLQLSGFFPVPEPLTVMEKISELIPIPPYAVYEEQAKELDAVSYRINRLIRALRVRGAYDNTIEGVKELLEAEDNTLLPLDNMAAIFSSGRKIEDVVMLLPLEKISAVVQQLYQERQQCKQVIYEITGIADIMRGSSQASETLGAQELKNQWGTLRLKKRQKRVQRYVRTCLRMMLEIAVSIFSEDTIKAMTGTDLLTGQEKAQLEQSLAMAQQQGMQPPPEVLTQLQRPSLTEVLALLKNDQLRNFRIDIETNSTIDAEATEDKQNITELLTALSQFLTGVAPLIENGTLPFEAAKSMLMAIIRRFRFGSEVEAQLEQMQPPQPKEDKPTAGDQMKLEAEKLKIEGEKQKAAIEAQKLQMEAEFLQREHALRMEELQWQREERILKHQQDMQRMAAQASMPPKAPTDVKGKPGIR